MEEGKLNTSEIEKKAVSEISNNNQLNDYERSNIKQVKIKFFFK